MTSIDYGLKNIENKEIILFHHFLGYGNPLESEIWFLGNEERLKHKDELIKDRIDANCLDKKCGDILLRDENNGFFTKKLEYKNTLHYVYQNIAKIGGEDFSKLFISEVFFLPSMEGDKLGIKYETDEKNRKDFYKNNNLEKELLTERLNKFRRLLDHKDCKCKTVYIYGNSEYKECLLDKCFKSLFVQIGNLKKSKYSSKVSILEYNNVKIFIIPFFEKEVEKMNINQQIKEIYKKYDYSNRQGEYSSKMI